MKISPFQQKKKEDLYRLARHLYTEGMTMREIGEKLGFSHSWAWKVLNNKLSTDGSRHELTK